MSRSETVPSGVTSLLRGMFPASEGLEIARKSISSKLVTGDRLISPAGSGAGNKGVSWLIGMSRSVSEEGASVRKSLVASSGGNAYSRGPLNGAAKLPIGEP